MTGTTDAARAAAGLPPGPPMRSGLVRSLRYYAAMARDPVGLVGRRFAAYGDAYYAPNRDGGLFVFRHPDHLHEVLSTKAASFTKQHSSFEQLATVLGEGLLTSDGEVWKRQRRMIGPAFAPARIAEYGAVMVEEGEVTARSWEGGGTRNVSEDMTALTLRIVSRALFGHDVSAADIRTIARAVASFQRSLLYAGALPAWMPGQGGLARDAASLDRLMFSLIEKRRARAGRAAERPDLLEMLVTAVDEEGAGDRLSVREVRDQLVTMFLAGHETTSHALTWTWHCLAQNPEVERRLEGELDRVLAGRAPTVADLERLPYTGQVVSEALRMYPPVYGIARRAREDVTIGPWRVPRGSEIMLWIYMTHHDPRWFPEPEAFRPERFAAAPERSEVAGSDGVGVAGGHPKFAYLPFGAGPRACIGKSFALMEARLLLATLAQRYRLAPARGPRLFGRELTRPVEIAPRITLTPKRAIRMVVERR